MSEHKVSFQSDVESVHISEEFALVGMNNGSVACISLKVQLHNSMINEETQTTIIIPIYFNCKYK